MKGHWSRTYRTSEHLAKLYQASLKRIANNVETNLILEDDDVEAHKCNVNEIDNINGLDAMTQLEVAKFCDNQD